MHKIDFEKAPKEHLATWRLFLISCVAVVAFVVVLLAAMAFFLV